MGRNKRESTELTKLFADRLDDLIQEAKNSGKNQKEISKEIGVSSGILSEWASDKKTPGIDGLFKISKCFGVSTDYLLGLSDTRAMEIDIKHATEYTGLSEAAAMKLHNLQKSSLKVMSIIIEDAIFGSFLSDCSHFFKRTADTKEKLTRGERIYWNSEDDSIIAPLTLKDMDACDYELHKICDRFRTLLTLSTGYSNLTFSAFEQEQTARLSKEGTNDEQ